MEGDVAEIKCISLWQPHASLVAFGEKPFETRHWSTRYRGLLAIHAAKREDNITTPGSGEFAKAFIEVSEKHGWGEWYWPEAEALDAMGRNTSPGKHWKGLGAILCICEVIACVPTESTLLNDLLTDRIFPHWHVFGDFSANRYAWRLRNVRRFREPIPLKGRQGIFNWEAPDDWESLLLPDVIHV
jgi:hypothetical protein